MIQQFIKKQLNIDSDNTINLIYNFMIKQTGIDCNDVLIDKNRIICKDMKIPTSSKEYFDFYPIEEWIAEIKVDNIDIKLIYGLDWFGIRHCGDEYCYYIAILKTN